MKVQQLFLRNVRSIKDLDLDFRDPVTGKPMSRIVLAGANGSGKTTILECLFGLLSNAGTYGLGESGSNSPLYDVELHLSSDANLNLTFEARLPNDTLAKFFVYYGMSKQFINERPTGSEEAIVGGRLPPLPRISGLNYLPETSLFRQLGESIRNAGKEEGKAAGSVIYFPHNRYLPSVEPGELRFESRVYQWAYRYKASEGWQGSTASYLFSLNYLDLEDRDRKVPANRFGQTVELVNSILDGKKIARIEKGRVVVETDKGETHGLSDLSSGEKQLVLLMIEITRRIVPGSIILVDEPEISLHSTWQRGLMAALDKIIEQYDAQIILATHSPEITASVMMPYEVISLNDLGLPRGKWEPEREAIA